MLVDLREAVSDSLMKSHARIDSVSCRVVRVVLSGLVGGETGLVGGRLVEAEVEGGLRSQIGVKRESPCIDPIAAAMYRTIGGACPLQPFRIELYRVFTGFLHSINGLLKPPSSRSTTCSSVNPTSLSSS